MSYKNTVWPCDYIPVIDFSFFVPSSTNQNGLIILIQKIIPHKSVVWSCELHTCNRFFILCSFFYIPTRMVSSSSLRRLSLIRIQSDHVNYIPVIYFEIFVVSSTNQNGIINIIKKIIPHKSTVWSCELDTCNRFFILCSFFHQSAHVNYISVMYFAIFVVSSTNQNGIINISKKIIPQNSTVWSCELHPHNRFFILCGFFHQLEWSHYPH